MKNRKLLTLVSSICLVLVLVALLLPACAKEEAPVTPAPASGLPEVHWKIQSLFPPPVEAFPGNLSVYGQGVRIAEMVKEKTNGKFVIEIYNPGALYKMTGLLDAVMTGAIEGSVASGIYFGGTIPEGFMDNSQPFTSKSVKEFYPVLFETDWIKVLRHAYAKHNIYWLCPLSTGTATWMGNFPIYKGADVKGKLISSGGWSARLLTSFGAKCTSLSPAELYIALQRGTVDAIAYPLYCGVTYKFFEVVEYAMWPGYASPPTSHFIVNLDAWNDLPKEYQDILNDTAMEMAKEQYSKYQGELDEWAVAEADKAGVKLTHLSDEAYNELARAMRPIFDEYAKETEDNAKLVKILRENFPLK